jgi:hypothetical protein
MPPAAREKLFEKSFSLDSLQKLLAGEMGTAIFPFLERKAQKKPHPLPDAAFS